MTTHDNPYDASIQTRIATKRKLSIWPYVWLNGVLILVVAVIFSLPFIALSDLQLSPGANDGDPVVYQTISGVSGPMFPEMAVVVAIPNAILFVWRIIWRRR